MDTLECIKARKSVHSFLEKPVEFEKISMILEAGNLAPSAGNLQDWRFILVTDKALIKLIAEHCSGQYWIGEAPIMIVVCSLPERQELFYGLRGKRLYNIQDASAAAENILLAATNLELGSCWVGGFDEAKVADLLSIPKEVRAQAVIPIGYSSDVSMEKKKAPLQSVVYFNRYGNKIEFIHRVLKDWSIEWDKALNETTMPFIQRSISRINERFKALNKNVKDEYNRRKEFREQKKKAKIEQQRQQPLR